MESLELTALELDQLASFQMLLMSYSYRDSDLDEMIQDFANFQEGNDKPLSITGNLEATKVLSEWFATRLCDISELGLIYEGTHPYYCFGGEPKERMSQFFNEVRNGLVSTGPMCARWETARASSSSDEEALVELWAEELTV